MTATAVRDGDGGETCPSQARLQTSSKTRRFYPRSSLPPISGIWSSAPPLLVRETLYQASSVGYVVIHIRMESALSIRAAFSGVRR